LCVHTIGFRRKYLASVWKQTCSLQQYYKSMKLLFSLSIFFYPSPLWSVVFFVRVQFVLFVSEDHKENVRCVHYCIGLVCIRKCTQYIIIICIHWYVYTFEWKIRSTEKCNTFLFQSYLLFFTCIFFTVIPKVTLSWWDL